MTPAMSDGLLMVKRLASRYRRSPLGYDDAVGVGNLALVIAAEHFDPSRGCPFLGFAYPRVKGAMRDANRRIHGSRSFPDVELPVPDDELDEQCACEDVACDCADIYRSISKLRHVERSVVLLTLAGYSQSEIGAMWGVGATRISQHLARVRKNLRRAVAA